jgi:hypothetical protein
LAAGESFGSVFLDADAADDDAGRLEATDEGDVLVGALVAVHDIVLVDEQRHLRVELVGPAEEVDGDVVIEPALVVPAIEHLVVYVPCDQSSPVTGYDGIEMPVHGGAQFGGRELLHPALHEFLFRPEEAMAAHGKLVVVGKLQQSVGLRELLLARGRADGIPLHGVLADQQVEAVEDVLTIPLLSGIGTRRVASDAGAEPERRAGLADGDGSVGAWLALRVEDAEGKIALAETSNTGVGLRAPLSCAKIAAHRGAGHTAKRPASKAMPVDLCYVARQ